MEKRPALWVCVPYVLGLSLAALTRHYLLAAGGVLLVMTAVLLRHGALWKYVLLSTLSCLTACCVYWYTDAARLLPQQRLAGQETVFSGKVTSAVAYPSGYARYEMKGTLDGTLPVRTELFCAEAALSYGENLTMRGIPERITSDYRFDSEQSARSRGIVLRFGPETELLETAPQAHPGIRSWILRWRETMTARILERTGEESGPMLTGMLFGDKPDMTLRSRLAMNRMGIGHILVVSGLHLDFIAVCAAWILERLPLRRWMQFVLMGTLALAFVLCAGETIPVTRACIMLFIREGGKLCFRQPDTCNSLGIAAFLICLLNPFAVHSASFWLSFSAVWGIAVFAPYMMPAQRPETAAQKLWAYYLRFVWAFVAMIPVNAVIFGEVALLTPLSNALLVPVCLAAMLLTVLAVLFGAQGVLAEPLLRGADLLAQGLLDVTLRVGQLPWTHAAVESRTILAILLTGTLSVVLTALLVKDRRSVARMAAAALVLTCLAGGVRQELRREELHVAVLGESHRMLLAVTAGEEALLFDMTGHSVLPAYARRYLRETGSLRALYRTKPTDVSTERYDMYLALLPPEEVTVLEEPREILFRGAVITASPDSVMIRYAGRSLQCAREQAVAEGQDVLILCGRNKAELPACGILVIPAEGCYQPDAHTYLGESNLELTIAKNGECRVRRLYGDT